MRTRKINFRPIFRGERSSARGRPPAGRAGRVRPPPHVLPQLHVSGLELPLLSLAPLPDEDGLSDEVGGQAPELGRLGDVGELLGLVLEDVVRFLLSLSPEVSDGVPGLPIGVVGGLFLGASRS